MTWVKLDDHITEHPKVIATGPFGLALFVAAIAYCNRNLTDGFVPRAAMATMIPSQWVDDKDVIWTAASHSGYAGEDFECLAIADLLVDADLLDNCPAGYWIHDYLDYQPSKADVLALREARSEAGRKGGQASAQAKALAKDKQPPSNGSSKDEANFNSVPEAVPEPEPVRTNRPGAQENQEDQENQDQGTTARSAAEVLAAAILPEHRDAGTRNVIVAYAQELVEDDFKEVLRELHKRRREGTIRNEGKWVNGALQKRAAKRAAAA